jgi:hypothetical protein
MKFAVVIGIACAAMTSTATAAAKWVQLGTGKTTGDFYVDLNSITWTENSATAWFKSTIFHNAAYPTAADVWTRVLVHCDTEEFETLDIVLHDATGAVVASQKGDAERHGIAPDSIMDTGQTAVCHPLRKK